MSPDETFLEGLLRALEEAGLEAIVVGSAAAALQGFAYMTQEVALLLRDTPKNREKIGRLCEALGGARPVEASTASTTITLIGPALAVDLMFDRIPGGLSFEEIQSRSVRVGVGAGVAVVASLADVIASKEASGRPTDVRQLPLLREALRVKRSDTNAGS